MSCNILITKSIGYPNLETNTLQVAIINLLITFKFMGKHWQGEVTEIKTEEKHYATDNGLGERVNIQYTYANLVDDKTKKIKNYVWKMSNKLEKNWVNLKFNSSFN